MTAQPNPFNATNLISAQMAEYRRKRREEAGKPYAICARLYSLADALKAAEQAEDAVDLPLDHPRWKPFCEALGEVDFGQLRKRIEDIANAWQAEIDAEPES